MMGRSIIWVYENLIYREYLLVFRVNLGEQGRLMSSSSTFESSVVDEDQLKLLMDIIGHIDLLKAQMVSNIAVESVF